ncbi:MAG TPA: alpha/beta hydrolase [Anaerolineales bacterium]|jgi:pimeloyl-ACP methyl ester carboxylesterase
MIPFTDFGGEGPQLHFLHANGYPPACYQPLMDLLKAQYRVRGMHLRPLWPHANPSEIGAWQPLTDDFLLFLEERKISPVIGVGHSMGAIITLRTALRRPDHFRALVLIDPVLFSPRFIAAYNLVKVMGLTNHFHPLIAGALKRRRKFDDLQELFTAYRRKRVFRYFSDGSLRAYINGIARPAAGGGYELVYSPEWEARIYQTGVWRDMDLWWGLPSLKLPTLIIRGAETDTFLAPSAQRVKRIRPETCMVALEKSTHLVPLEKPQETCETISNFLKENL